MQRWFDLREGHLSHETTKNRCVELRGSAELSGCADSIRATEIERHSTAHAPDHRAA
ncbi:MAG TPA: hypothetical protein VFU02_09820 [Polyangiaceae bacterium]|nr:hypothetical protein [Polyangiaceae bacterium]